jgi:lipoprotein NlpI
MAAADDPDPNKKKSQVCEANFYAGELSLSKGSKDEAIPLFRLAANGCPHGFIEWTAANDELKALGAAAP